MNDSEKPKPTVQDYMTIAARIIILLLVLYFLATCTLTVTVVPAS